MNEFLIFLEHVGKPITLCGSFRIDRDVRFLFAKVTNRSDQRIQFGRDTGVFRGDKTECLLRVCRTEKNRGITFAFGALRGELPVPYRRRSELNKVFGFVDVVVQAEKGELLVARRRSFELVLDAPKRGILTGCHRQTQR